MPLIRRKIGELIKEFSLRNVDDLSLPFYGINIDKEFMPSHANIDRVDRKKYKMIGKKELIVLPIAFSTLKQSFT